MQADLLEVQNQSARASCKQLRDRTNFPAGQKEDSSKAGAEQQQQQCSTTSTAEDSHSCRALGASKQQQEHDYPLPTVIDCMNVITTMPWPRDGWPFTFANPDALHAPVTMQHFKNIAEFLQQHHGLEYTTLSCTSTGIIQMNLPKGKMQLFPTKATQRSCVKCKLHGSTIYAKHTRNILLRSAWFADGHLLMKDRHILPHGLRFTPGSLSLNLPLPPPPKRAGVK